MSRRMSMANRLADEKIMGIEPLPGVKDDLGLNLNWYNYFMDDETIREYVVAHLKAIKSNLVDKIGNVPTYELRTTASIFRMTDRGFNLKEIYSKRMAHLVSMIEKYPPTKVESVQDRLRAKEAAVLDRLYDIIEIMVMGRQSYYDFKTFFKDAALSATSMQMVRANLLSKKAYGHERIVVDMILPHLAPKDDGSTPTKKKIVIRKKRKAKVKSPAKMVSRMKHKEKDDTLKISSVAPVSVIGATELWTFNTKTRIMTVYRSNTGFSMKGTTLLDWDKDSSESKMVRKPEETLKSVVSGGKIVLRKLMDSLSTRNKEVNGRINGDTLLVRVSR